MLRLVLPLFEAVLSTALESDEFRLWLESTDGPDAIVSIERIRAHAGDECELRGW